MANFKKEYLGIQKEQNVFLNILEKLIGNIIFMKLINYITLHVLLCDGNHAKGKTFIYFNESKGTTFCEEIIEIMIRSLGMFKLNKGMIILCETKVSLELVHEWEDL